MDNPVYGGENPLVEKSQFILSLVEQIDPTGVGPQHKSIIDRCTAAVYREAEQSGKIPTLSTLREKLLEQPEPEARQIALSLELYTTGSLDIFGHGSNVDLNKRVVVFDIHGLGTQLKPAGLLVITDILKHTKSQNRLMRKKYFIRSAWSSLDFKCWLENRIRHSKALKLLKF